MEKKKYLEKKGIPVYDSVNKGLVQVRWYKKEKRGKLLVIEA